MKRKLAIIIAVILLFGVMYPAFAVIPTTRQLNTGRTIIDTDGSDGYSGDYVVAYNPSSYGSVSSGTLSGRIETTLDVGVVPQSAVEVKATEDEEAKPNIISYHPDDEAETNYDIKQTKSASTKAYSVGSTRTFYMNLYSGGAANITFECLAVGDHCYIWTPVSSGSNLHPLDLIDPTYGGILCEEFDSKFDTMIDSFGDFYDPQGEGRINLMMYNIDDGWTPGNGYVAGFYTDSDYYNNSCAMINIDTYPQVEWTTTSGEYKKDIKECYNVLMHEFQHLINANVSGNATTWMNEMKSAAAEEIVYPGSSISSRIRSWLGDTYMQLFDDKGEVSGLFTKKEYSAKSTLHSGATLYQWDSSNANVYYTYSQFSLLAQYLYSVAGTNTIFKKMSQSIDSGVSSEGSISAAMTGTPMQGKSTAEIIKNFRVALVANDAESYDGLYGFVHQDGYNPGEYYNMDNFYETLSPIIYTGTSANIGAGGAIVIKPVGNNYMPPSDASSSLQYVGITTKTLFGYNTSGNDFGARTEKAEYEYLRDEYIIPGEKYLIVASNAYAMTNTFNASELGSVAVTVADGAATGAITDNELWIFEDAGVENGYNIQSVGLTGRYVGESSSGYPILPNSAPAAYYFMYNSDAHKLGVYGTPPTSIWTHLHGDINGFEFYSQNSASEIYLYRQSEIDPDTVSGVSLTPTTINQLMMDTTYQLTATIRPATALNQNVTWSSDDESIATVNESGLVRGISAGSTYINVTTDDGGYTARCRVIVVEPLAGAATGVTITSESDTILEMQTMQLTAEIMPEDYDPNAIESVSWQLKNGTAVVTQSQTNKLSATITGYISGTAVVYVKVVNIDGTYCEATKNIEITTGDPQEPADNTSYVLADTIEAGKEYVIVAQMNGEYYALTSLMDKVDPFSLQAKKVVITEINGQNYITESMAAFSSIEWQIVERAESGYDIQWKSSDLKLSATTTATLKLFDPYKDCVWHFDNWGDGAYRIWQSKFAVWRNLVLDSGMYYKPANLTDSTMSADCTDTFLLFEKTLEPTPSEYIDGDANGDGVVNTGDATLALRFCVDLATVDEIVMKAADMNDNGSVDTGDVVCILKLCVE